MSLNIMAGLQRGAAVLGALQGLVPVMGALVNQAESLFPTAGAGATKLAWVQGILNDVLTFSGVAIQDVASLSGTLMAVINNVVAAAKTPVAQLPPVPAPVAPPAAA